MSTIHHDITTPAPPQLQEVDDGVFAYIQPDGTWWINNTGFLVGQRGVISIDTCATVRRTRAYLDAIRTVTPQPVRTVVNTHHHGDHTFGNFMFAGATIVGHEATRAGVLDWGEPKSAVGVDLGRFPGACHRAKEKPRRRTDGSSTFAYY